ncbi:serine hydrolase domain-containing protein [Kitasatospora purpeofusca]|uniref:serine hydrolase domain-containing protein n=1 Tax=Kitasatospora purpeofusca TaxID=67352 RepID=UPI002252A3FF|nr:serine hydrolase domain-containing protein [Kitasatospora purpeofusca]MCX4752068.1 beta-lactamase family protein [Kitasatospora purpeofusca]WSR31671.1 beta-lactamase family protein [Kitasatospora purpeofusca]WSR39697.1 beta-lactamase family protein [Kitasatospora purpeofusca]
MRPSRRSALLRLATVTAVSALVALGVPATSAGGATGAGAGATATTGGGAGSEHGRPCVGTPTPTGGPALDVLEVAERAKDELGLKSVIVKVTADGRELLTTALGESMTGVPARPDMHFRNGNIAISYLGTALLRLVDEGVVGLDEPVARWLPDLPRGDRTTLRMLGASTSGLVDYVTTPGFGETVYADPFRQWTPEELVDISARQDPWYRPGESWSYSHANFVLLGAALERITGTRLDHLLQQKVLGPLGLHGTANSFTPDIPTPVLHAFTADRGRYEESTFWNPSWTTAPGAVQTTDICDLASSAVGVGSGELLSPAAYRELLNPGTVGLGGATGKCPDTVCIPQTEATHYGMGVLVLDDWISQHPLFFGYSASQDYLPCEHLAIAVSTTDGPDAAGGHSAHTIAQRIAAVLAPEHPIPDFG